MYPSYGYNQEGSLGAFLNSVVGSINTGYAYATGSPTASLFDYYAAPTTQNNTTSYLLIGGIIVLVYLLAKA